MESQEAEAGARETARGDAAKSDTADTGKTNGLPADSTPILWYGLPHGYFELDLIPSAARIAEVADHVNGLPGEHRERFGQFLQFYLRTIEFLRTQRVVSAAFGMHPNDDGEPVPSVLTISTTPANTGNAKAVVAAMLQIADSTDPDSGVRPLQLPCGTAFLLETTRRESIPGPPEDGSGDHPESEVWQGNVSIPDDRDSSVVTVQLVTPATEQKDDYRNILLGVAHTISFTDPAPDEATNTGEPPAHGSTVADAMRNTFG